MLDKALKRLLNFDPWKGSCRKSFEEINGKKFEVRSYGLCQFEEVAFLWPDGKRFYRLKRDLKIWAKEGDEKTPRIEYFNGREKRRYLGPQNCFVEFCETIKRCQKPSDQTFLLVGQALKLEEGILDLYIKFLKKFFYPEA